MARLRYWTVAILAIIGGIVVAREVDGWIGADPPDGCYFHAEELVCSDD